MKPILLALPFLLAACAGSSETFDPVGDQEYAAIGYEPFWTVAVGGDAIVLTRGPGPDEAGNAVRSVRYPRVLPREQNGVRRYESEGTMGVISIEARPGPCTTGERGRTYRDKVRVYLSGVMLEGCGGRELR